jgi:CO/xanthine dehydrogenase FAD-binding subunit
VGAGLVAEEARVTELVAARTIEELRELAPTGDLLAGGTDLLLRIQEGRKVARLIDVSRLLDGPPVVRRADDFVYISALAPLTRVIAELDGVLPGLDASAWLFASVRIRNRATIGGNLGNASPAGDTIPPLVAAGAVAVLEGANGSRRVAVVDLATGPGRTVVGPDEWIDRIEVPLPAGEEGFRKFGTRQADAISIVSLAWRWEKDADGTFTNVSLALGAVAPTVVRARRAEAELEGRRPEPRVVEAAVAALVSDISPIDDARASARFRREVAGVLLREELGVRRRAISGRATVRTPTRRTA